MGEEILTGYRMMWLLTMFDLPVQTKKERRAATKFRDFLLNQGFEMCQYSVYLRFVAGKEQADTFIQRISFAAPNTGSVQILMFTDRQYEKIVSFEGGEREAAKENPDFFELF